jgi:hypothetical protein
MNAERMGTGGAPDQGDYEAGACGDLTRAKNHWDGLAVRAGSLIVQLWCFIHRRIKSPFELNCKCSSVLLASFRLIVAGVGVKSFYLAGADMIWRTGCRVAAVWQIAQHNMLGVPDISAMLPKLISEYAPKASK